MAAPVTTIVDHAEAVARAAADAFVDCAREAVARRRTFTVALSGGSTPKRLYELLAADARLDARMWSHMHFFWGDERCVPPDHRDSNYHMTREAMLAHVPVPRLNQHRIEGEREPHVAAAGYEDTMQRALPERVDGLPVIDLVLLGLGTDGHTASLFPGTTLLDERGRWVAAGWVPSVQAWRVTMTLPVLAAGRLVLGLAAGADKADAVARLLGPPGEPMIPARMVTAAAAQARWILDRAAVSGLPAGTA